MLSRQREQEERREIAGSTGGTTYYQRAQTDLELENKGRFANVNPPLEAWPKLPSGPWSGPDVVGLEPPLGFSVEAVEACGTAPEIEASLARAREPATVASSPTGAGTPAPAVSSLPTGDGAVTSTEVAAPTYRRRRFT